MSMNVALRLFLLVGALAVFAMVIRKIRKSEMQSSDSVFWLLFAGSFVLVAVFPGIAFALSDLLGFDSPSNFVFIYAIAILLIKLFSLSAEVARLRQKLVALTQEIALREKR
ncbi:DUF2304 domain-containing protein [Xiamenia xianingshaonis]|uniref:DUF2304 domain-containing protein n=1 Tax=Xiamenia xianingshaonis TaxID=2682776 RepID=UPI0021BD01CE|nr:DUF2304 domain-containing protein [Xiamenia xianingshaonis]